MLEQAQTALAVPLPISDVLPEVVATLQAAGTAVLVSPPGTGKTSLVPLALADALARRSPGAGAGTDAGRGAGAEAGRVIVAEPRRVATRAAARRMAELIGEAAGQRIGYTVRGESRTSRQTVVEVVTTGVLVQRLQRDPELAGVAAVMIDECHERHLDTDLALAFSLETRAVLRPDLLLLAASATAQSQRLAAILGSAEEPAPVIGTDAPLFPVELLWRPPTQTMDAPRGLRVDPRYLDHVATVTREALRERDGDVLVFLPGTGEINLVARRLADVGASADVLPLHGQLSHRDQDAALRPGPRRRMVLATSVAESSLTVPGVRIVVDAGLSRVPRMDVSRGLGALTTIRASRASGQQRAGRAGREAAGTVYRCWSPADQARLPAHPDPEIAIADLAGFALALARWGDPDASGLKLLDAPPAAAFAVARQTLQALGAVDQDGRITPRGQRIATAGVHPRLGRALLDGAELVGRTRAAEVVALLAEHTTGEDLAAEWRRLRGNSSRNDSQRTWQEEVRRLANVSIDGSSTSAGTSGVPNDLAAAMVTALAYPERLARARPVKVSSTGTAAPSGEFLMASGTAAAVQPGSPLAAAPWLAIATAQRQAGAASATIRLAAALDEGTALVLGEDQRSTADEVTWAAGDVHAVRVDRLGAIVLAQRPLKDPPRAAVEAALLDGVRQEGLSLLNWTEAARALRARLAFCRSAEPEAGWPEVTDEALLQHLPAWLGSVLAKARRRSDLSHLNVERSLRTLLEYRQAARLDEVAPEGLQVPSGSRIRLTYDHDYAQPATPVLAVKLQEVFGWTATPRIGGGRVPVVLHLLSPARRPAAVTSDLESFWQNGYPQVRSSLRGTYPRHPWPEDPLTAAATARVSRRK